MLALSSNSQQAIAERIGFEDVQHTSSTLTIYIINCGSANNVQINSVFIYDSSNNIVGVYPGSPSQISYLYTIGGSGTLINGDGKSLNIGQGSLLYRHANWLLSETLVLRT